MHYPDQDRQTQDSGAQICFHRIYKKWKFLEAALSSSCSSRNSDSHSVMNPSYRLAGVDEFPLLFPQSVQLPLFLTLHLLQLSL